MPQIISIGECMVELFAEEALSTTPTFHKSLGGDTFNVLAMASRLGTSCGYITKVGDDPFATFLLESWQKEGVDTSHAKMVPGFNGIYFISLLPRGEREFTYYRRGSAASTLTPQDLDEEYIGAATILHFSAITQAISRSSRAAVLKAARMAKDQGVLVSYDPNLRPGLWSLQEALQAFGEVMPFLDIVLPSAPEETEKLLGASSPRQAVEYLWDKGVKIVAIKAGHLGCIVGTEGSIEPFDSIAPRGVVDTTGAGDAFDGAFLHALVQGLSPFEAARWGVAAAGLQVGGRGAIASMPTRAEVEGYLPLVKKD